jgi:hypothetical protein
VRAAVNGKIPAVLETPRNQRNSLQGRVEGAVVMDGQLWYQYTAHHLNEQVHERPSPVSPGVSPKNAQQFAFDLKAGLADIRRRRP